MRIFLFSLLLCSLPRLSKMGYVKRDAPSAPRLHAKKREEERLAEKRTPLPKPPPIKTEKEKEELRARMKEKYEKKFDIPERILFMALESVLYDEEQANNLITTMIEDDLKRQKVRLNKCWLFFNIYSGKRS